MSWIRNQSKTSGQFSVYNVASFATVGLWPLRGENPINVTEIGHSACSWLLRLWCRVSDQYAHRAGWLTFRSNPVKTVLLAWITVKSRCVNTARIAVVSFRGIFDLTLHIALTNGNCTQFVPPDSTIGDFFIATIDVEIPHLAVADDRKREWPVTRPHLQVFNALCFHRERMLLGVGLNEVCENLFFLSQIPGCYELLCLRPE